MRGKLGMTGNDQDRRGLSSEGSRASFLFPEDRKRPGLSCPGRKSEQEVIGSFPHR